MSSSIAGRRPSSNGDEHPPSKRIRCAASIIEEDIGDPIEDDATARQKLREAGFDPDQPSEPAEDKPRDFPGPSDISPMIYFSYKGDLPMCRYLLTYGTRNDLTRGCSRGFWFPMYAAAYAGHVVVCQWLYDRGAAEEVHRRCGVDETWHHGVGLDLKGTCWSPLKTARSNRRENVAKWLILNGALHGGGSFNTTYARSDLMSIHDADEKSDIEFETRLTDLMVWVLDTTTSYDAFRMFLMGTLPLPADDCSASLQAILTRDLHSERAARLIVRKTPPDDRIVMLHKLSTPLHVLGGFPEILELMADFVGIVKQRRGRDRLCDLATFFATPSESDDEC